MKAESFISGGAVEKLFLYSIDALEIEAISLL
jgi:hypothetical protein